MIGVYDLCSAHQADLNRKQVMLKLVKALRDEVFACTTAGKSLENCLDQSQILGSIS